MDDPSNAAAPATRGSGRGTSGTHAVLVAFSLSTCGEPPSCTQPPRKYRFHGVATSEPWLIGRGSDGPVDQASVAGS
jgi:hypothetical protein